MHGFNRTGLLCALMGLLLGSAVAIADPQLGQVDTFSGGSADSWQFGHGTPAVISTGGPDAAPSPYLNMVSKGGFGADSKMVIFNASQWKGSYAANGVMLVQMKLKNFGSTPLTLRWVLQTGTGSAAGYCSTTGFSLPADGAWHNAQFPLDAADMTAVGGPPAFSSVFSNVVEVRFLESAAPAVEGDVINASVGMADITAASIPEPATAIVLLALPLLISRRRIPMRR